MKPINELMDQLPQAIGPETEEPGLIPLPLPPTNGNHSATPDLWPRNFDGPQINLNWHPHLSEVVKRVTRWHKQETGALVLSGGYGCGKTAIAKIVIHAIGGSIPVIDWSSGRPESVKNAVFYTEPDLLSDIRETFRPGSGSSEAALIRRCQGAKLLVLDDLGAAYVKEDSQRWYEDLIWRVFNERAGKKTLLTTNLTPPELKNHVGGRAYSRLKEMLGPFENYVDMFQVPDYRGKDW